MTEQTLSQAIDGLAMKKANEHVKRISLGISALFKQHEYVNGGNSGQWCGETIYAVMEAHLNWHKDKTRRSNQPPLPKSEELFLCYRSEVLKELLERMPLTKELVRMQEEANVAHTDEF